MELILRIFKKFLSNSYAWKRTKKQWNIQEKAQIWNFGTISQLLYSQ